MEQTRTILNYDLPVDQPSTRLSNILKSPELLNYVKTQILGPIIDIKFVNHQRVCGLTVKQHLDIWSSSNRKLIVTWSLDEARKTHHKLEDTLNKNKTLKQELTAQKLRGGDLYIGNFQSQLITKFQQLLRQHPPSFTLTHPKGQEKGTQEMKIVHNWTPENLHKFLEEAGFGYLSKHSKFALEFMKDGELREKRNRAAHGTEEQSRDFIRVRFRGGELWRWRALYRFVYGREICEGGEGEDDVEDEESGGDGDEWKEGERKFR